MLPHPKREETKSLPSLPMSSPSRLAKALAILLSTTFLDAAQYTGLPAGDEVALGSMEVRGRR